MFNFGRICIMWCFWKVSRNRLAGLQSRHTTRVLHCISGFLGRTA